MTRSVFWRKAGDIRELFFLLSNSLPEPHTIMLCVRNLECCAEDYRELGEEYVSEATVPPLRGT